MIKRVPTVGIVVLQENKVLLVEHLDGAGHVTGSFGTPGGRVDHGESVEDAAIRELREETGLDVRKEDLVKLPKIYEADLPRKNGEILYVSHTVFATKKFSGELTPSEETRPQWISTNTISSLNLLPNIEDMVEKAKRILG